VVTEFLSAAGSSPMDWETSRLLRMPQISAQTLGPSF